MFRTLNSSNRNQSMTNLVSIFVTFVVSSAAVLACTGCSVPTDDNVPPHRVRQLALSDLKCMEPSFKTIKHYFKGSATAEATGAAWDCFDGALEEFTSETRGSKADSYTAEELRTFFQIYYLNGRTISDGFLVDLMRLKQLLAGGDPLILKKSELNTVRTSLKLLKVESLRLLPYLPYFKMTVSIESVQANPAPLNDALAALGVSSRQVSQIFRESSIVYTTSDIESLLHNAGQFLGKWELPEKAISYLPTFEVAKAFVVGGSGDKISPTEFLPLFDRMGRLGALHYRAHYLLTGVSPIRGQGLDQFEISADDAFALLSEVVKSKPGQVIEFAQVEQLLDEAARLKLLKPEFPVNAAKKAFRLILQKLLVTSSVPELSRPAGIDTQTLTALHGLLKTFIDRQRAWENVEDAAVQQGLVSRGASVSVKTAKALWPQFYKSPATADDDILKLFSRELPLTFYDSGAINFDRHASDQGLSEGSFVKMNVISLIDRMIMSSYAKSKVQSLSQPEFAQFFNDFFDLAQDFDLLQPKDKTLVKTSFDEASLFTFSARADGRLSDLELFDYISELQAASLMSGRAYADAGASCRAVGVDYFKQPTYDAACVRRLLGSHFDQYFPELPAWVVMAHGQTSGGNWRDLNVGLETAVRDDGFSDAPITKSDLNRMAMVMQYIESIYLRFDRDHSGTLDIVEARKALPLFAPKLMKGSGFKSDKKILALFMYILEKGKPPTSVGEKLDFIVSWSRKPSKWADVHSDRFDFLAVIGSMAQKK
jgi:hypothetical protein